MSLFKRTKKLHQVEEQSEKMVETMEQEVKEASVPEQAEKKEEGQAFFVVQEVFELEEKGCVFAGVVAGGSIHKDDKVTIRKTDGRKLESVITSIELDGTYQIMEAAKGMSVAISLEGMGKEDVSKGDRILVGEESKIIEELTNAEELYVLYDEQTGLPFVGMLCAEVYTKKEYAEQAVEHYKNVFKTLTVKTVTRENSEVTNGMPLFAYFYYLGLEQIVIDNGVRGIMINRGEVIPAPDWSSVPQEQRPVMNPAVRFKLNCYLAQVRSGITYEGQKEHLELQEKDTIETMKQGVYIVPIKKEEVDSSEKPPISIGIMRDNQGRGFLPLFTDWMEYHKIYDTKEWSAMLCTFQEGITVGYENDGTVINPLGENMTLTKELIESLFPEMICEKQ